MFDFNTAFRLLTHAFTFQKGRLTSLSFKRLIFIFVFLPLFLLHTLINHIFLGLDWIFFPKFRHQGLHKSIFIVGMPRSGTSFLLNLICSNPHQFTCFRLGEMVFAPSILQKHFYTALSKIDQKSGGYLKSGILRLEKIIFNKTKGVHDISFFAREEDEFLFLYLFRSSYLSFIFPEVQTHYSLMNRDELLGTKAGQQMMRFYRNCVKRHQYFYNRSGDRYFVSKNPTYPGMIKLLHQSFPYAHYLNPQRAVLERFSSTLSLNYRLLSASCNVSDPQPLKSETLETIQHWEKNLKAFSQGNTQCLNIDFRELTAQPLETIKRIYAHIEENFDDETEAHYQTFEKAAKSYSSTHQYPLVSTPEFEQLKENSNA